MTYFKNCTTLEEVKKLYKILAKQYHPDHGGDTATMQAINTEYSFACAHIANNSGWTKEEVNNSIFDMEAYKEAIDAIINLSGINIEVVGNWIWVTGNTYQHRQALKNAHYFFASKKVAWYFRTDEYKVNNRKKLTLDQIRTKYGSERIYTSYKPSYLN